MTIIAEICEILKTSEHLAEFDKGVLQLMGQLLNQSVTETLERLDKEMIAPYLADSWGYCLSLLKLLLDLSRKRGFTGRITLI